jgi:peptidoglycan hydrolase-like protein with peptidoglycan-binding domain
LIGRERAGQAPPSQPADTIPLVSKLRLIPALVPAFAALILCASAPAAATPTPTAPAPVPPAPAAPPPASSAGGQIKLVVQHAVGKPPFVIAGGRLVVRGIVVPYVGGQTVKVSLYREGKKVDVKNVSVQAIGNGAGQFHIGYSSGDAGVLQARAVHYATPQQAAFAGASEKVHVASPDLSGGDTGPSVRLLQSELNALHFVVPLNGVFDEATGRAVIAFRKMTGLARVPNTNATVFKRLQEGGGVFHVRYPQDGRHVEADLTRQVLAEIEPGGRVRALYTMSSGKPSTPTVIGHFSVYSKTPGTNSEGMVDSNYFIRGYAIHGYAEVPTYAASHGCLRVPIPDAAAIYGWVQYGTPVDVYNEGGGGSHHVNSHAGP